MSTDFSDLDEAFNLYSEADVVQQRGRINIADYPSGHIELTLNPSNTKNFDSSEPAYIELLNKIIQYIDTSLKSYIKITQFKYTFEFCKSGKRHLHAMIYVKPLQVIGPMGLIYDVAEYIGKLIRRKIMPSQCYPDFFRVQLSPFCIQYVVDYVDERVNYWEHYIKKDQ